MATNSFTPNLGLIIEPNYTAAAKANLFKLDNIQGVAYVDNAGNVVIDAQADVKINSVNDGMIRLGDPSAPPAKIQLNADLIEFNSIPNTGLIVYYKNLNFTDGTLADIPDYAAVVTAVINANPFVVAAFNHSIAQGNPHNTTAHEVGSYTIAETNGLLTTKIDVSTFYAHTTDLNNPHDTTATQVGAYTTAQTDTFLSAKATNISLSSHTSNLNNPHQTTAVQVGAYTISQVDGFLTLKADLSALSAHTSNVSNPHVTTAHQVGTYTDSEIDSKILAVGGSAVKIDSSDTTPGYLAAKLLAGAGTSLTVGTPSGNETLTVANTDTGSAAVSAHNIAYDHTKIAHSNRTALDNVSGTNTGDETQSSIKSKLGAASSGVDGYLTGSDWTTFNGKQSALTIGALTGTANRTSISGGTGAVIGSGASVDINTSLLPSPVLADATKVLMASGANTAGWSVLPPGVTKYATKVNFPVSASDGDLGLALDTDTLYAFNVGLNVWVAIANPLAATGTSSNVISTVVARDSSGNFSAGTITAALTGSASGNQPLDSDLTAISALTGPGIAVKTTTDPTAPAWATRSITGTTNRLTVSNGNGVSANPTIDVNSTLLPSPVLADAGKFLKSSGADTSSWQLLGASDIPNLDANKITSGTIDIARLPNSVIERMVIVADAVARHALTTAAVQNGDTVKQTDTGEMWYVYDDTQLTVDAGYRVYSAGTSTNFSGSLIGDVTGTQGATAISSATVTGKLLTGLSPIAGTVGAGDTILQGFNKLAGDFAQVNPSQIKTVGVSGAQYTSIQTAINAISDATSSKPYLIYLYPGIYNEQVTLKDWVYIQGIDVNTCIITQPNVAIQGTISAGATSGVDALTCTLTPNSTTPCVGINVSGDLLVQNLQINVTTGASFNSSIQGINVTALARMHIINVQLGIFPTLGTVSSVYGVNVGGSATTSISECNCSITSSSTVGTYYSYNLSTTGNFYIKDSIGFINCTNVGFAGTCIGINVTSVGPSTRRAKNVTLALTSAGGGTVYGVQLDSGGNSALMQYDDLSMIITGFTTKYSANSGSTDSQRVSLTSTNTDLLQSNTGLSVITPQDMQASGFVRWGGAGNYWGFVVGTRVFTILRPGAGVIRGTPVTWAAGQTVTITNFATNTIYINAAGVLSTTTVDTDDTYFSNIILFDIWSDGTYYQVSKENHNYNFQTCVRNSWEGVFSTLLTGKGANLTLLGAAANRQIAIVGDDKIYDQDLQSVITSDPVTALTFYPNYVNASGKMQQFSAPNTAIVSNYNNAGTPTNASNNGYVNKRIGAIKDSLNSATPLYVTIMDTVQYTGAGAVNNAANAIASGAVAAFPAEAQDLEVVQLGFVTIKANGSGGGSITSITISKQAFGTALIGGNSANQASLITTSTTNFVASGNVSSELSGADVTVQAALDTLARGIAPRYVIALTWVGTGPYTMTITGATHLRGTDPIVQVRALNTGTVYRVVQMDVTIDDSNGDVVITSTSNPTGKVVIL